MNTPTFTTSTEKYEVSRLSDSMEFMHMVYILVEWKDFPDTMATWEPISILHEDLPKMIKEFIRNMKDKNIKKKAENFLK